MRVAPKSYANFWPNLAIYSNWREKNSKLDSTLLFFGEFVSLLGHHWAVLEVWSRCKRKTFVCKFSTCTQNFHWWNFEGKICDFARLLLNAVICYNDRLTKKERYLLFCYIPLGCSSNGGSDFYLFPPMMDENFIFRWIKEAWELCHIAVCDFDQIEEIQTFAVIFSFHIEWLFVTL